MAFQSVESSSAWTQVVIAELQADLATLRLEVDRLCGAVAELTMEEGRLKGGSIRDAIDAAAEVATRARASFQKRFSHADADFHEYVQDIRGYVRENPITAALLFTICGYMAGRVR